MYCKKTLIFKGIITICDMINYYEIPVISFFVAQKDRQSIDFIDILAVFDLFITEKGTNKGYFIIHRGALGRINTVNIDFL